MQIKFKICSLSRPEAVDAAIKSGASHVGFVFTRRPTLCGVSLAQAAALVGRVPRHVRKVGVFFEQDSVFFDAAIACAGLHVLQLHATDPRQASAERTRTGCSVWGVVPVSTAKDLRAAERWQGAADRILYDVKASEDAGIGNIPCDWTMFKKFHHPLPWIRGGRLDQNNISDAITNTGAKMVDFTSCVEIKPYIKFQREIGAFVDAVKSSGRQL